MGGGERVSVGEYRAMVGAKISPFKARMSASEYNSTFGKEKVAVRASNKSKYRNKKTEVEGIKFDSQKEAARYQDLKIQQFGGGISGLELQKVYEIEINGVKVCKYKADFTYVLDGVLVVEDVKGIKTAVYRLKKKLLKAVYGIDILET